ncbi:uncharacterized protein [Parasteatoda tepidariorum]|uniref:uncharacterized protein isoform X4 n=1 Tax=Parasteatoda tepidariorum TaxID=114398 RepID=UPI001C729C8A|nr:uncharacterized protein LOC107452386 isoform X1 [Parasteatoda tepidariorum]
MKKSSLHSLKAYMSDESNSSDNQRTDERNKSNDSNGKVTQELDESIPTTDVYEKGIHSSSLNTTINTRKRKYIEKKSKQKQFKKNSKKKHTKDISTEKCYVPKEEQTNCASDGSLVMKNHKPSSAFSFSLLSYFKEPIEGSHLSDYELEQADFLSNWPAEVKKESDIVPPKLTTKPSHLLEPEMESAISLPSSSAKAKKDLDNNLLKGAVKSIHLSDSESDEDSSLPSSPVEAKKDFGSYVLSNIKEPIEVICLSDTDLEQADSTSKSPTQVEEQRDTDSHSLMPCFKAASLSSESEQNSSASFGEHTQEHAENLSETNLKAYDKNIHSSSQNLSINDQKKQYERKHQEKGALENSRKRKSLVSNEYSSISDCEESSHWSSDDNSLQASKASCFSESSHVFKHVPLTDTNDPVSSIPLVSESLKRSYSMTDEEYSIPSLKRSHSRTEEDISTSSLKQSHSRSKDFSTPSSKRRSHSRWSEDSSTPSSKRRHSRTEEDISTSFLKEIDSSTKDFSTPSSKRSHSRTEEDVSTPSLKIRHSPTIEDSSTSSLKRSNLTCGSHQKEDIIDVSANLSMLDKSLSSVPSPQLLPPGETLLPQPLSFYKMVPPPSLKRSHSLIEEDSENDNKHLFQRSTDNHKSYNFTSSDSPIIRGRRSLPAKTREDFSPSCNYSTFHSAGHSSSFQLDTPKRALNSSDSSRRHSYHDKYSPRSTYRSCATDQTPYSPTDSYRRHKRFKSELPYYNPSDLLTFQSDVGFIDSHCHLDFLFGRLSYDGSFKDYQKQNKDSFPVCFKGCIAIFCNPPTFIKRKRFWQDLLAEENVWASFGCHPHYSKNYNDEVEESIMRALDHPKVCALGEIGLDYSRKNDCSKDIQEKVFIRQLKIALKRKLPLVIHCRDAHEDGLEIMKRMVPKNYFIHLHCFTDTWEIAQKWLEEFPNLYIGLTNLVTFPSAAEVHEVAKKIPLSRLLLETDTPYFIPKPLTRHPSNLRNSHPGMAIHVAAQVAALKEGIPLELVLYKTRQNTKAVYKI